MPPNKKKPKIHPSTTRSPCRIKKPITFRLLLIKDLPFRDLNIFNSSLWRAILVPCFHYHYKVLKLYYFPTIHVFWRDIKSGRDLPKCSELFPSNVKTSSNIIY